MNQKRKHIRPLAAFKRLNKSLYDTLFRFAKAEANSKKAIERMWYFMYCFYKWYYPKFLQNASFIYDEKGNRTNIGTGVEIGQLLLVSWYYDSTEFGIEIADYIFELWQKKQQQGGQFNDLEFAEICRHIRMDFQYYVQHPDNAKLTLYENLFPKTTDEGLSLFLEMRKAQRKKGVNYWIQKYEGIEERFFELENRLNEMGQIEPE